LETKAPSREIVDYRNEPHPAAILNGLRSQGEIQVWAEGEDKIKINGVDRNHLEPSDTLAIWTVPPGHWELKSAIECVAPKKVFLFANNPGMDEERAFLTRLAGLTKHVINKRDGKIALAELAVATAHRAGIVRMGLLWLGAKGYIRVLWGEDQLEESSGAEFLHLKPGTGLENSDLIEITAELKMMLEETTAYRKHFTRADKDSLIPN
jgi:hypothetical protein